MRAWAILRAPVSGHTLTKRRYRSLGAMNLFLLNLQIGRGRSEMPPHLAGAFPGRGADTPD